jgi:hypothetical protein
MAAAQEPASQAGVRQSSPAPQESPSAMDAKPATTQVASKPDVELSTTSKTASAESPDDLICRRERETGSRMTKEVCRTRAQVEAQHRDVEELKRQTQEKGNRVNPGG